VVINNPSSSMGKSFFLQAANKLVMQTSAIMILKYLLIAFIF